uniref:Phosphatidylinositol transfer protein N-terminal domain-containing protein n=1 Tax=Ditylenchus dipsaci TaxID=166011 RepID=A0A915CYA5_9BILA
MPTKEYRFPMPMMMDQFVHALRYSAARNAESISEGGDTVQVIERRILQTSVFSVPSGDCHYTSLRLTMNNARAVVPRGLHRFLPAHAFDVIQEFWSDQSSHRLRITSPRYKSLLIEVDVKVTNAEVASTNIFALTGRSLDRDVVLWMPSTIACYGKRTEDPNLMLQRLSEGLDLYRRIGKQQIYQE